MKELISESVAARLLSSGDKVAVAVSGGKDSIALLKWFSNSAQNFGAEFFAVNIEHGIRGESSVSDSAFVADYCNKNNIPLISFKVDSLKTAEEKGITVEQAARELRYECFKSLIESGKCNKVATAHHKDDNAETVLMRIFRGTGIRGLKGITELRDGVYIRPLLAVTKKDIAEFISKNNLPFVEDETNADSKYRRNYIRNEILPVIKKQYPEVADSILRLSRNAAEIEDFLDSIIPDIQISDKVASFKITDKRPLVIKRQALKCFRALDIFADIEERHLALLVDLAKAVNGTKLDMPYNVTAFKEYDYLSFEIKSQTENKEIKITLPFEGTINGYKVKIKKFDGKLDKGELVFSALKLPEDAVLRSRREGDIFTKFGGGTKTLGDYLTDKKIPLRLRGNLPVIASNGVILAVCGVEISDKIKAENIKNDTTNLYKITTEEL